MNTYRQDVSPQDTHSKVIGYLLWIFGFTGAHRFYYGKPVTGTIWFFTFGLLGIGWLIDLFLIPAMDREADLRFTAGPIEYNVAWILLTFLGVFGLHRMYQGKWISGLLYLVTGGLFFLGVLYDSGPSTTRFLCATRRTAAPSSKSIAGKRRSACLRLERRGSSLVADPPIHQGVAHHTRQAVAEEWAVFALRQPGLAGDGRGGRIEHHQVSC